MDTEKQLENCIEACNQSLKAFNDSTDSTKPGKITFYCGQADETQIWFMKITPKGFVFNHEEFPEAKVDDFAKTFIELLEREFNVKFTKKSVTVE